MNVQEAVTIDRVGMRFGGLHALSDVSFELLPGRVTGLIGPNGAGKTTAINVISGTMHPTSGAIRVDGKDVTRRKAHERRQISRTFQVPLALAGMTVLENVLVGMHVSEGYGFLRAALRTPGVRRAEVKARTRARDLLAEFGIEDLADRDAGTLPLGQKRVLEVARALASDSGAILLDEVASGLTQREQEEMSQRVVALRDRRVAVLVVEHNLRFVKSTADHLVVLNFGSVIFDGSVSEGLADSQVVKAYLGSAIRADT